MYNNERIGVGIITCNRKDTYKNLFDLVNINKDVDIIVTVKNKEFDYGENDPLHFADGLRIFYFNVKEDLGVGYCKNICFEKLLDSKCDHIFLVEDDIKIKKLEVFKTYIDTAKIFNILHMNFCQAWDHANSKFIKPIYSLSYKNMILDISFRLCGDFSYFTSNIIKKCGYFNDKDYINALEHIEHTYRITLMNGTLPFYAFADIHNSIEYIEDTGIESSISKSNTSLYNERLNHAFLKFVKTYGLTLNQIHIPTQQEVINFLINNR